MYGHSELTCQQKTTKALLSVPVHFDANHQFFFATNINEHIRPRFWYVVLANCDKVYGITYSIHWLNLQASSWQAEFGVNEQGLNTINLVFFLIFTSITAAYGACGRVCACQIHSSPTIVYCLWSMPIPTSILCIYISTIDMLWLIVVLVVGFFLSVPLRFCIANVICRGTHAVGQCTCARFACICWYTTHSHHHIQRIKLST